MEDTENKLTTLGIIMKSCESPADFYVLCFCFLLAMEGYYDELVRFIYATD
ncbi:hypothetical protein MUP07_04365 [Candidatus Bathyarchaeota archaeon]|nr:hypothetical protein [Candidatus Bathyarchaeota archaeon]